MRLRQLRKERSLSVRDLAKMAGVVPLTISEAERGLRTPHPRTVRKIADALGVEPIAIIGDELAQEEPASPKASAPDSSPLSDQDRRTLDGLDGYCDYLDRKLRAGQLTPEEVEGERATYDALAPLLARAMRDEADELREQHPDALDVSPWAAVGPRVARYTALVMRLIDEADELDRARREAYKLAG